MSHRRSLERQALIDQIIAILRDAEGFPLSTGQIAKSLGDHLVTLGLPSPPLPRPPCWPDDLEDPGGRENAHCSRCRGFHREPVWRPYQPQDIRGLLNSLAKKGEVEKFAPDSRKHYWSRQDIDREF